VTDFPSLIRISDGKSAAKKIINEFSKFGFISLATDFPSLIRISDGKSVTKEINTIFSHLFLVAENPSLILYP
jgi:hypothetical protein